jgi:hypothetical protein
MIEKQIHLDAFNYWYMLPKRSNGPVAKKFGVTETSVRKWRHKLNWDARALKRDKALKEKEDKQAVESIADMNARHVKEYKMLQGKALERLTRARIEKDRDAITALDTGIKGERMAKGEPTEVISNQVSGALTIEDIKNAVQLRRKQAKPAE